MGLPALRHEPTSARDTRPRLRVVKPQARPGSRPSARGRTSHAAAHQAFVFFTVVVAVVAVLGLGRVWLSVQAAQASIDSGRLQRAIKAERYTGDLLEVQQSALATPSRIQAIAGRTMGMAPATSVMYLDIGGQTASRTPVAVAPSRPMPNGKLGGVLAKAMNVAASEAQVLLVGDVGLTSAK